MHATPTSSNDYVLRLLSYLASDPTNRPIRIDLAHAAFEAGQYDMCSKVLEELRQEAPHTDQLLNLDGLNAMAIGAPERAVEAFLAVPEASRNPVVLYNLAYALALSAKYEEALDYLTPPVLAALPMAVSLRIRVLHHLGRLDTAITLGMQYADTQQDVTAPLATALFDAGHTVDAHKYALRAGDSIDARIILGLLDLELGAIDSAERRFTEVLQHEPAHRRGMLGMGLVRVAQQQFGVAASLLDATARSLRNHAGTWLAAGWAYFYQDDLPIARERFERAGTIDRSFADVHGSLAVLDCKEGNWTDARRRIEIALRLNPASISAALANSFIQAFDGNPENARRVIETALQTPLGYNGRSLASVFSGYTNFFEKKSE